MLSTHLLKTTNRKKTGTISIGGKLNRIKISYFPCTPNFGYLDRLIDRRFSRGSLLLVVLSSREYHIRREDGTFRK